MSNTGTQLGGNVGIAGDKRLAVWRRAVIDGLQRTLNEMKTQLPPGVQLVPIQDASRPIRVAGENVRQVLRASASGETILISAASRR